MGWLDELKTWIPKPVGPPPQDASSPFASHSAQRSYGERYPVQGFGVTQTPSGATPATDNNFPLNGELAQINLNGSGAGVITKTPGQVASGASGGSGAGRRSGLEWNVTAITVTVAPAPGNANVINAPTIAWYLSWGVLPNTANLNPADCVATSQLVPTTSGPQVVNCVFPATIIPGDWIIVTVANGDIGAQVTMRVYGTVVPPGV